MIDKRTTYQLLVPGAIILVSAWVIWRWPELTKHVEGIREARALLLILPFVPYAFFALGIIMGWRFNNGGMILVCLVLGFSYFGTHSHVKPVGQQASVGLSIPELSRLLLPLNIGFLAALTRRRIFSAIGLSGLGLILFQAAVILVLSHSANSLISNSLLGISGRLAHSLFEGSALPLKVAAFLHHRTFPFITNSGLLAGASFLAGFGLLFSFLKSKTDPLMAGFLGALVAGFLGLTGDSSGPSAMIYFLGAGIMLLASAVESSFAMAYIDELTGLPGRRSLNRALVNLGKKYSIAMIDIDHFKKFNDKYGHKTGDQVLRMIASKLKNITGDAKVFRYGGEEFTAIFPGKGIEDALPHLEAYKKIIESSPFIVRGKERKKRTSEDRGRGKARSGQKAKVTVSIGVAAPGKNISGPDKVLKAADKLLYRAKRAGRNRVEYQKT